MCPRHLAESTQGSYWEARVNLSCDLFCKMNSAVVYLLVWKVRWPLAADNVCRQKVWC